MAAIKKRQLPAAFRLMTEGGMIMRAVEEDCFADVAHLSGYDLSQGNLMLVCSSFLEVGRYPNSMRGIRDHIIWWAILRILYWKYGERLIPDEQYRALDKHIFLTVNSTWDTDPPMRDLYWYGVARSVREDGWEPNLGNYLGKYYSPPSTTTNTRIHWIEQATRRLRRPKPKK